MTYLVRSRVNGETRQFPCEPSQTALDVLRDALRLTGTKYGCGTGDCGACTILLGGRMVCACLVMAAELEGTEITTIEGVARQDTLHPVQRSLIDFGGFQCGICMPGIVVAAVTLLAAVPTPTETQVRLWLAGNLCRCTGYDKIVRAVMAAAASSRSSGDATV